MWPVGMHLCRDIWALCLSNTSSTGSQPPAASYQPTPLRPHNDTAGRQEWASQQAEKPWMSGFSALTLLLLLCSWPSNSVCLSNLWSITAVPSPWQKLNKVGCYFDPMLSLPSPSLHFIWLAPIRVCVFLLCHQLTVGRSAQWVSFCFVGFFFGGGD